MLLYNILYNIHYLNNLQYIEQNKLLFIGRLGSKKLKLNNNLFCLIKYIYIYIYKYYNIKLYINILNLIRFFYMSILYGYVGRFRIIGRGYKVYGSNNNLLFKLGYSHVIYFILPIFYKFFKKEKYQNFYKIVSLNLNELNYLLNIIKNFKYPDTYSKKGIFVQNNIINFKEGKKSFTL